MKTLIITLLLSLTAHAEIFEVHSVLKHQYQKDIWILKLSDGRVGFWNEFDDSRIASSSLAHSVIEADLSEDAVLTNLKVIKFIQEEVSAPVVEKELFTPRYVPTVYASYNDATNALRQMRGAWTDTAQCYDKSHIWSYEEMAYYSRYLQKVFLFFSDSYISRYNYRWWFHTAPYALVRMNNQTVERVMDHSFSNYPLKYKVWTDMFMKNKVECKVVTKYSDYSTRPGEDDCYMIKSSIYFWQPKDLEAFERTRIEKTKFIYWEVQHAYWNGFGLRVN